MQYWLLQGFFADLLWLDVEKVFPKNGKKARM